MALRHVGKETRKAGRPESESAEGVLALICESKLSNGFVLRVQLFCVVSLCGTDRMQNVGKRTANPVFNSLASQRKMPSP